METISETAAFRRASRRLSRTLLWYTLLFVGAAVLVTVVQALLIPGALELPAEVLIGRISQTGFGSIIGTLLALSLVWRHARKNQLALFQKSGREMQSLLFLRLFCCFMAPQLLFSVCSTGFEMILNQFGLTAEQAIDAASAGSSDLSMLLYAGIVGPIAEELLFRGAALRSLEPFGRRFALIASALLFGIFHGNLTQGVFAFFVGLVLGHVTLEFSIFWAILMHILNNLVYGDALGCLLSHLPEAAANALFSGLNLTFFLAACAIIWRERDFLRERYAAPCTVSHPYLRMAASVSFLLFAGVQLLLALNGVQPLT